MSKVGKKTIEIPKDVKVKIEGQKIVVEGPKGKLEKEFLPHVGFEVKEDKVFVFEKEKTKRPNSKALWGTYRQLIKNMIEGVTKGFEKKLEVSGVGFKVEKVGNELIFKVGFSHPVKISPPPGIEVSVEKNIISVSGVDKELVGNFAAKIREIKPADPYKEKGIKYLGEKIRRKIMKKARMAK